MYSEEKTGRDLSITRWAAGVVSLILCVEPYRTGSQQERPEYQFPDGKAGYADTNQIFSDGQDE